MARGHERQAAQAGDRDIASVGMCAKGTVAVLLAFQERQTGVNCILSRSIDHARRLTAIRQSLPQRRWLILGKCTQDHSAANQPQRGTTRSCKKSTTVHDLGSLVLLLPLLGDGTVVLLKCFVKAWHETLLGIGVHFQAFG